MNKLTSRLKTPLRDDQIEFVERSLARSFEVGRVVASGSQIEVEYRDGSLEKKIEAATKRLVFVAKSINNECVFESRRVSRYEGDPQPHLERIRDVIPVQPGFFTFQGGFLRVFHALNDRVRAFAADLGAIEQEYPTVWPVRLFKQIDYFHEFPHQVILCAPVKDDFSAREAFAQRYGKARDFETVEMGELIADSEYGLEPAVCDCCYFGLEGRTDLENAYYTCYNKVFRNERSGSNRLDRLTNFSVRDIMFVGTEDFVLECRQTLIEVLSRFLADLELEAKIETANDPFFANDAAMKTAFQNAHELKYELLARIPHLGREIAVGSVNFHLDFFGSAFSIETREGGPAYSGCIGVGMERMAYALYCQHGSELDDWPASVLDYLKLNPRLGADRATGQGAA